MEDGKVMIDILYEDNHLIVVNKKPNIPVQKDDSGDLDLLTIMKNYIKEKYNKPGNVYLGLVHRLDRPVSGIMVFAKTSKAASRLSKQIREGKMKKTYHAVVEGNIKEKGTFVDNLLKDHKENKTIVHRDGKESILEYEKIKYLENMSLVKINLITGRSHQIRVQFSSRNYPLYGDHKYNKNCKDKLNIALISTELSFYHPTTKEILAFKLELPKRKPFSSFKI
jgi:Pseudouridylate synthases, 23S RNA-specific